MFQIVLHRLFGLAANVLNQRRSQSQLSLGNWQHLHVAKFNAPLSKYLNFEYNNADVDNTVSSYQHWHAGEFITP